jgi:RNA polymerase sigma-70 factor (ECF subfamily)
VFAVALAVVRDRVAAEDVLHDAFVRIWEKAHTYRRGTRPRAWVLAIARNTAIDARRRNAHGPAVDALDRPPSPQSRLGWNCGNEYIDRSR